MRVERVAPSANIDYDVIPADSFKRNRNCARIRARDVLRDPVLCRYDYTIGYCQGFSSISAVTLILQLVAGPGLSVLAQLHPVNREPLSDVRSAADWNQCSAMPRRVRRTISRDPLAAPQRRRYEDRALGANAGLGAVAFDL